MKKAYLNILEQKRGIVFLLIIVVLFIFFDKQCINCYNIYIKLGGNL